MRQNPLGDRGTPAEAWTDKVTGDRTPYLAYILRAGSCEDLLSSPQRRLLLASLAEHGRVLASKRTYTRDNHGLFADLGLARLTAFIPFSEQAERWRELARTRFETTLRRRLSQGVWLEHCSAYQFLAIRPLDSMLAVLGPDPELTELRDRMRAAAAWFVRPDGQMTQFGDSNLEPVPAWAQGQAPGTQAYFGAGFAFVREPGANGGLGYLAVTDGFHNLTHKHADELSFELFDHGATDRHRHRPLPQGPGRDPRLRGLQPRPQRPRRRRARPADLRPGARLRVRPDGRRGGRRLVRDRGPQPAVARAGRRSRAGSSSTAPGPRS